jgi:hypothetical protein
LSESVYGTSQALLSEGVPVDGMSIQQGYTEELPGELYSDEIVVGPGQIRSGEIIIQ